MLWLILFPQLVVAVSIIAGLTGAGATAFVGMFDMPLQIPALVLVAVTASIILLGQYKTVEKVTTIIAIIISVAVLAAAIATRHEAGGLGKGFVPSLPPNLKFDEVLPWPGFMLAG